MMLYSDYWLKRFVLGAEHMIDEGNLKLISLVYNVEIQNSYMGPRVPGLRGIAARIGRTRGLVVHNLSGALYDGSQWGHLDARRGLRGSRRNVSMSDISQVPAHAVSSGGGWA